MEQQEQIHPDYLKGFNEGYLISKHLPDLAAKLSEAVKNSPYSDGFKGGKKQYEFEEKEGKRPSWLKSDRLSSLGEISPDKSKEKDRDDIEPER